MRTMFLGSLVLVIAACHREPPAPVTPVKVASATPAPPPAAAKPVVAAPPPPVDLLAPELAFARLHGFNERVLAAARLAKTNASSAQVKGYAASLIKQHETADTALLAMGKTLKLEPKPYASFNLPDVEKKAEEAERARFEALERLRGPDFDFGFLGVLGDGERREIDFLQRLGEMSLVAERKSLAPKLQKTERADAKTAATDLKKLPKKHG